ncbi:hypothetical protein Taro_026802 [Colocasia esculenta]|uniref:Uncharacterized protein n=1 Tax=Colocasia esculenta TaxID=4460 RepID=A0A843VLP5_COLES|nr:hypothetical protein [Colocasia esculenta]
MPGIPAAMPCTHVGVGRGVDGSFDYISVTPPYTAVDYGILMEQLGRSPLVGKESFIVVEYPLRTFMAESCGYLVKALLNGTTSNMRLRGADSLSLSTRMLLMPLTQRQKPYG